MSENIIAFGGDTTTRDLWSGGPVGSTGMSRLLSPKSRSFSMVAWQQAKPILDSELNLMQQIQNQIHADYLRTMLTSGIISLDLATNVTDKLNALRISNAVAHVNGWLVNLYGANRTDNASDIVFPAAPYSGTREDLAFAEVWFEEVAPTGSPEDDDESVYRHGGVDSGTVANDLQDSVAGDETSRRIQLRWRIRTISDVNFTDYPYGINNADRVKAHGGSNSDTNHTYTAVSGQDGLFVAGDGSTSSCTALKCVDGYVYALPLFHVHRRNQTAYSSTDNPSGAGTYPAASGRTDGLYSNVIAPCDVTPIYQRASVYDGGEGNTRKAILNDLMRSVRGCETELDKWQKQRIQQGEAIMYNKYVISGCVINAISGTRNVKLTKTGTYAATNYSTVYVDGTVVGISDTQDSVAAVPTNSGTAAVNYYAYIDGNQSAGYTVKVAAAVPDGKLGLYKITVPAGDTAANLNTASFTDIRRVEPSKNYYNTRPTVAVPFPGYAAVDAPDYDVLLSVLSADGPDPGIEVIERQSTYFVVALDGEADNIRFRWTMVNQVI